MKKLKKWCLGIAVVVLLAFIFMMIVPAPGSKKASDERKVEAPTPAKKAVPKDQVTLNYGNYAKVTHSQIISSIKKALPGELRLEDYDCRLKKVEIKNKKISVYLDLQLRPPSKSWIIKEGKAWLGYVAALGLADDKGNLIGNVYSTGYDISILMWTWFKEDGSEVLPWGHAIIFNSGKPFTTSSVPREGKWIDGRGMEILK